MSSRLNIIDRPLKLRTHLIASHGSVIAVADADAVSVFSIANFDITIRGRINVVGSAVFLAISKINSYLYRLAIFDESNCLKLYQIRLRPIKEVPMIVDSCGTFPLNIIPTFVLLTPEICLICSDQASVIVNGSIQCLAVSASTAAVTSGYYALGSSENLSLFKGNCLQWSRSCSSISSLVFASLCLVSGHHNGTISVYNINGKLLSRIFVCDSILRLLGPVKFRLQSIPTNQLLHSLPLQLFNHEPDIFPSDYVIILQTTTGIMFWPYCHKNNGEIQTPTIRDILNCDPSYKLNERIEDLCLIPSDEGFTLLLASQHGSMAKTFMPKLSRNADSNAADLDESSISVSGTETLKHKEIGFVEDRLEECGKSIPDELIMDFLPVDGECSHNLTGLSRKSTVLQEVMDLKRQCRRSCLELAKLRSSLSAFTEAMVKSICEVSEFLQEDVMRI